jgi:hypothetical protein
MRRVVSIGLLAVWLVFISIEFLAFADIDMAKDRSVYL